jgi:hypothetical protein
MLALLLLLPPDSCPQTEKAAFPFYIYGSFGDADKVHFHPSGRMGDVHSVRLWGNCRESPLTGTSCIKVIYDVSATSRRSIGWAGVYWLSPANNWGRVPDMGYDLRGARRLVFHARGSNGGEKISFKLGGVWNEYGDTTEACLPAVTLTNQWKKYEIPLPNNNLHRIIGGFCWSASAKDNPNGAVFYLDEIYYE